MILREGVDPELEEFADMLLAAHRRLEGSHSFDDITVYLTEEQLMLRRDREVLNVTGMPDPSVAEGHYRRAHNPLTRERARFRNAGKFDPWSVPMSVYTRQLGLPTGMTGYNFDEMSCARDALLPQCHFRASQVCHLDRLQRCRIRAAMKNVHGIHERIAVRNSLAQKFGVAPVVIERVLRG